jgi:hypothetical protein
MSIDSTDKFGVLVEARDYEGTLYLHSLSWGRLMDDVVVPYEKGEAFFVDGVSVDKKSLRRIKIVRQSKHFEGQFMELHHFASSPSSGAFVRAQDYPTRLAVLFRGEGEDVTGQVINAFRIGILPRLKEYLPKRDELISAALTLFVEGTKALAARGGA